RVGRDAGDRSEDPVVGKRLRPERIDLQRWGGALSPRACGQEHGDGTHRESALHEAPSKDGGLSLRRGGAGQEIAARCWLLVTGYWLLDEPATSNQQPVPILSA